MKKPYLKPVSIVYVLAYEAVLLTGTNYIQVEEHKVMRQKN